MLSMDVNNLCINVYNNRNRCTDVFKVHQCSEHVHVQRVRMNGNLCRCRGVGVAMLAFIICLCKPGKALVICQYLRHSFGLCFVWRSESAVQPSTAWLRLGTAAREREGKSKRQQFLLRQAASSYSLSHLLLSSGVILIRIYYYVQKSDFRFIAILKVMISLIKPWVEWE